MPAISGTYRLKGGQGEPPHPQPGNGLLDLPEAVACCWQTHLPELNTRLVIIVLLQSGRFSITSCSVKHLRLSSLLIQVYEAKPYFPEKGPVCLITFSNRRLFNRSLHAIFLASVYWHMLWSKSKNYF